MKKIFCLLMITVMLALCLTGCGGGSYTEPIETAIRITYYGETDKILSAFPEEYINWYEDKYYWRDFEEDYVSDWAEVEEYFVEKFGEDFDVDYKLVEKKKADNATFQSMKDYFAEEYGIPADDVKKAYSFDIEYLISGSKGMDTDEDYDLFSVKIRDKWYLVDRYSNDRFDFTCDAW